MSGYNNSLLYFKHYYADEAINWHPESDPEKQRNEDIFKRKNEQLFGAVFPGESTFSYQSAFNAIELKTTYPGLLLGSGIAHGSGLLGEMKLGFFLDYTTGLPVIPGSSVKGVLRSAFSQGYLKATKDKGITENAKAILEAKAAQTIVYLQHYLEKITSKVWEKDEIGALETFLFGSYETGKSASPMSGRTVFHDAIPLNADRVTINGRQTGTYLGDDYITPHNKALKNSRGETIVPAALRNPIPIAFLKVLPGVVFRFQFVLFEFKSEPGGYELLSKEQIEKLFRYILLDFGIGAKTNVGYGRLEEPGETPPPSQRISDEYVEKSLPIAPTAPKTPPPPPPPQVLPESTIPPKYHYKKPLRVGQDLVGKVVKNKKDKNVLLIVLNGIAKKYPCNGIEDFELNAFVKVKNIPSKLGDITEPLTDPQRLENPDSIH